ncbi:GIY-YIG nuclease family protein [Flintibacter muris]|uniref:GIY-YIG nuclease family protein n=1 Tax=Flintibacter muris TaxID=2941327 RepID=UPI0020406D2B|nr:GIY-YIG nuclease family protein [Flintibacter muris]
MDIKRRKELSEAYKNRHLDMGVIAFRCTATDETFLAAATETAAKSNRLRFQLSTGNCPNRRLQALWKQYGEEAFELSVVKRLECEDPRKDHSEELETLFELCLLEDPKAEKL